MTTCHRSFPALLAGAAALAIAAAAAADLPPLIPRETLFGNPVREFPTVAPDGTRLAWLAPDGKGVMQVWIAGLDGADARSVTNDPHRGVQGYRWAGDSRHVLYEQDADGDENFHVFSAEIGGGFVRDLTPFAGARAQNLLTSPRRPAEILVGLNLRKRDAFDMYRIDLETGAVRIDTENPGDVLSWTTDADFVIRAATAFDPKTAATILRVRDTAGAPWRDLVSWPFEDSTMFGQVNGGTVVLGFEPDGRSLDVVSALHSDTARVERIDASTGRVLAIVAENPHGDVAMDPLADVAPLALTDPSTGRLQAVAFEYGMPEWTFLDAGMRADFEKLARGRRGFLYPISRDGADRRWIVLQQVDDGPLTFLLHDRKTGETKTLFQDQPELAKYTLAPQRFMTIRARDGVVLPAYLTLPVGIPSKNLPLIVTPHGGPWWRDHWGFDPYTAWLTNRGYAVLAVEFRGSIGFGKKFLNLGNHEFGLKMEDDSIDGARWAVAQGIADPKRIGIMGASAGGYATLRAISEHPEMFAAAVDLVGPSDLALLLSTMPPGWGAVKTRWVRRLGDVEHDSELNRKLSPLFHAEAIRTPLLVGQGANDPRVNIENSNRMVAALREKKIPVEYIVYPDEGHGFQRPENNLDFNGRTEEFFARHLHGRAQPWTKVEGSTAEVR
jgi:dipeptidyl aminopeptidase/acylaminoacyl peptidase